MHTADVSESRLGLSEAILSEGISPPLTNKVNSLFKRYAANQGINEEAVRQKYIDQVPMKRSCQYEDIANVVVFMASDESSYMTGQAINVTSGQEIR